MHSPGNIWAAPDWNAWLIIYMINGSNFKLNLLCLRDFMIKMVLYRRILIEALWVEQHPRAVTLFFFRSLSLGS